MSVPRIAEIESRITSEDPEVLRECLRFIDDRLAKEGDRARIAENRATAMLALIGAASAFLVYVADELPVRVGDKGIFLPLVTFAATILFLAKSTFYAIRTLGVLVQYRVTAESVFEVQSLPLVEALRSELTGKIWECQMAVAPNTGRLYRLQRCQRSLMFATFSLMAIGSTFLLDGAWLSSVEPCASIVVGSLSILVLIGADPGLERLGIWHFR